LESAVIAIGVAGRWNRIRRESGGIVVVVTFGGAC
jgi:hypothetical protein